MSDFKKDNGVTFYVPKGILEQIKWEWDVNQINDNILEFINRKMILISKSSTGKIRVAETEYHWDNELNGFVINRKTGQYKGKMTEAPFILITKGKASRSVKEQAELEFNAIVKKYKDKGYKELDKELTDYTEEELFEILGEVTTGNSGIVKPMLAKQADKVTNKKIFDKNYFGSRKINGVRCLIYLGEDNKVHTISRGSIDYDVPLMNIIYHDKLEALFKKYPCLILDGEIYKHGWTLNQISGVCRKRETATDGIDLEFYWYDIVDTSESFESRLEMMNYIASELELKSFDPYRKWEKNDLKIQMVPQEEISGYDNMMKLHNEYVKEGWEGLVIRLKSAVYGPNKRTNDMIKIKVYHDSEYEIVGMQEGELRPIDDMVFIMKTESGQEFKAKPMGSYEQKEWYIANIDSLIGKMATLKWFEMSGKEGSDIPQQPIFISVRDYE